MNFTASNDDVSKLTLLGSANTQYKLDEPSVNILETFPNLFDNDYLIEISHPEFTSLCPKTGQPDFAKIHIDYIPNKKCVESKSLKLYLVAYRNHKSFMETIVNTIKQDLVSLLEPKYLRVCGEFNPRGGTYLNPTAMHVAPGISVSELWNTLQLLGRKN